MACSGVPRAAQRNVGPGLDGVVAFPPDYMERYRQQGYWEDRPLISHFRERFVLYAERVAVVDGARQVTYRELGEQSERVALNLLDLGMRPLDRIVIQLPNTLEFVQLYFGLQQIGAIPIMALPSHRFREVSQFVRLAGAVATATPLSGRDVSFIDMVNRLRTENDTLRIGLVLDDAAPDGFVPIGDLLSGEPRHTRADLQTIQAKLNPCDPALFQLSGGTTGIPKLIPRTHNDYAFNSKLAVSVCDVRADDVLLDVLPISHNLPLACPGLQGFLLNGAKVVMGPSTRPRDVFGLIQQHRVTHIHVVPALLIRWINDPSVVEFDLASVRVIQSGGQRLQPETRRRTEQVFANCTVQENFGMSEGLLMFVRLDDPPAVRLETVGRPICPDDEVRIVDEDDQDVPDGDVGEMLARGPYTLRGYFRSPEHNARAFTSDGFYRSGDLMRRHPSGELHGRRPQEGPDQSRRREDQRRGDRKSHPRPSRGAERRLRGPAGSGAGRADVRLRHPQARRHLDARRPCSVSRGRRDRQTQTPRAPRDPGRVPALPIGKVSKKDLVSLVATTH